MCKLSSAHFRQPAQQSPVLLLTSQEALPTLCSPSRKTHQVIVRGDQYSEEVPAEQASRVRGT